MTEEITSNMPVVRLKHPDGTRKTLEEIECEVIEYTISDCAGNMTAAAAGLNIGRSTLYRKHSADKKPA